MQQQPQLNKGYPSKPFMPLTVVNLMLLYVHIQEKKWLNFVLLCSISTIVFFQDGTGNSINTVSVFILYTQITPIKWIQYTCTSQCVDCWIAHYQETYNGCHLQFWRHEPQYPKCKCLVRTVQRNEMFRRCFEIYVSKRFWILLIYLERFIEWLKIQESWILGACNMCYQNHCS